MSRLSAKQFNERYAVGTYLICRVNSVYGIPAKILCRAIDETDRTIVKVSIKPGYIDIDSLNC